MGIFHKNKDEKPIGLKRMVLPWTDLPTARADYVTFSSIHFVKGRYASGCFANKHAVSGIIIYIEGVGDARHIHLARAFYTLKAL